jgi:general secretion pathway protein G
MISRQRLLQASRRGFTLIEILIVILIIAILASLLLPAVRGAMIRANIAKQVDDMGRLTSALEAFKARYGIYPPSRIRLRESTAYNLNEGFDAHSVKYLKRIWPSLALPTYSGTAGDAMGQNAPTVPTANRFLWCADTPQKVADASASSGTPKGSWTGVYELEGDECLVFFLGGIPEFDRPTFLATGNLPAGITLHGFAKRPNDPSGVPDATVPTSMVRDDKLMDFDAKRLTIRVGQDQIANPLANGSDTLSINGNSYTTNETFPGPTTQFLFTLGNEASTNKLPSYLSLGPDAKLDQRPWAYFSSYEGAGYRPDDVNFANSQSAAGSGWCEALDNVAYPSAIAAQTFQRRDLPPTNGAFPSTTSSFPNPYSESDPGPNLAVGKQVRFVNPTTYQLISTGADGRYGPGGQIPRSMYPPPPATATDNPPTVSYVDLRTGGASYDNITNVSGSARLGEFNDAQSNKN